MGDNLGQCNWIFRGQSDTNFELQPSIYRVQNGMPVYKNILLNLTSQFVSGVPDMESAITNRVKCYNKLEEAHQNRLIEIIEARIVGLS